MRKKTVGAIIFASLVVITGWYSNKKETQKLDVTLTSIEAFANDESGWEDLYECSCGLIWGTGCKRDNWGVDCAADHIADCSNYTNNCSN